MADQHQPRTTRGMVATQHHLAADAATAMLRRGGSAADAAVAAAAVLTVVDPRSTGLGGDLFALYWEPGAPSPHGLEAVGWAPEGMTTSALRSAGHTRMPVDGPWTVTVPGAPAGWQVLLDRFGKLDVATVLGPAVDLARDGFVVAPAVADEWTGAVEKLRRDPTASAVFLPGGRAPRAGDTMRLPDLARTLEAFVADGADPFYRGRIAEQIGATVAAAGGPLRADDLAGWPGPGWVEPLHVSYRGHEVWEMPPPGQGLVVLEALALLDGLVETDEVAREHHAIEALKHAFADAADHVADPSVVPVPVGDLLSGGRLDTLRQRMLEGEPAIADVGRPSDTVYVAVADDDGGACSFIQSVYDGFGSGVVVPGTGLALQNRGSGFVLREGHPNAPAPRKRPYHTIIPAMLSRDGAFHGCLGVVGGYMQPQGQVQVLRNLLDRGMTPQQACDAPRFRVHRGHDVGFEDGYREELRTALRGRGHHDTDLHRHERGGAQLVVRKGGAWVGGSDHRKDGAVRGR